MNNKLSLITLMLCAFLAGCGQDQYAIERQYYGVQKRASEVMANPEATPPMELKQVVDTLEDFVAKHPQTNVAVDAQFTIAHLYLAVKEYSKAQDELTKIEQAYAKSDVITSEAVFQRATAYEDQGDWDSALKQYQVLIKSYPRTVNGLEAPLRIAMHYKSKFQPDNMMNSLRDAVTHYQNLALQAPRSPLALQARALIAQCYGELGEWKDAVKTLEAITEDFKGKIQTEKFMFDIAGIYAKHLKDPAAAKAVLNKVMQDNPEGRVNETAQAMLEQLKKDSQ
jgi:TolA-binding protein